MHPHVFVPPPAPQQPENLPHTARGYLIGADPGFPGGDATVVGVSRPAGPSEVLGKQSSGRLWRTYRLQKDLLG